MGLLGDIVVTGAASHEQSVPQWDASVLPMAEELHEGLLPLSPPGSCK